MENQVIDIESRPLQELTLKDILPFLRQIISEEIKTKTKPIPLKMSGVKSEMFGEFSQKKPLTHYELADSHL